MDFNPSLSDSHLAISARAAGARRRRQADAPAHRQDVPGGVPQSAARNAARFGGGGVDRQKTRVHDRFLRRAAVVFSRRRHRLDGRPRHGERSRHERRAAALPQRRVHHRGRAADGNALENRLLDARRRATVRRANHHRRHQGRGQGQGRRPVHQHRRHRRHRTRARTSRRKACSPATPCW